MVQQVNLSPQHSKRRLPPSQGSHAQNSQPIQPLKLPPLRSYTTAPIAQPILPAHSPKNSTLEEGVADSTGRRTAAVTCSMPTCSMSNSLPELGDRQDNVAVIPQPIPQSSPQLIPQSSQQPIRQQHKSGLWEWSLIGLVAVAGIFGGVGTSAMLWLSSLPPLPKCERVTWRSLDGQRLFCAQEAVSSGNLQDLLTGINLLKDWSPDHPLKPEAQRLIARWSREILISAQEEIDHNDLKGAVAIAKQVPSSSPAYAEAQTAIAHWQAHWQKGEATIKIAQKAIQQKNWTQASKQVLVLGELEPAYWRLQRADQLSQQILEGKQAQQALLAAQKLEVQKIAQIGQPLVREGASGAIAEHAAESTESSTGENLSSLEDSQPVEIESTEPDAPFRSEIGSDIFPADAALEKSFEGYYDERYFENSY